MELWLGNLDPQATDDELRELVRKYSSLEVKQIKREAGDGSRPGAILDFESEKWEAVDALQRRLNGMYWKNRAMSAYLPLRPGMKK
jgi:hypothetical protein